MHADESSLLYAAFTEQADLDLEWYHNIKNLVDKFGTGGSVHSSINTRQNLQSLFRVKWSDAKGNSSKLDFYNKLKQNFNPEKYLLISNVAHRNALSRLRISAHNLYIERGRYTKPITPRDDCICLFCKHNYNVTTVESEEHIINDCELYTPIRNSVIAKLMLTHTPPFTILDIFTNTTDSPLFNGLAGKMAFYIQEINETFVRYYSQSLLFHTSTGKCTLM